MADFKASKIIGDITALTPEPDTLYLHRIGSGFDLYASNQSGVLQKLNHPKELISGVGRPDIPATLSTENQHECSVAENGALFTSTDGAGVGALQWQKTVDGWKLNDGDTGWIDLTKSSTPNNSPIFRIRREGSLVHLLLDQWCGNRIELPQGFTAGANWYQFVAPLRDGTRANVELSGSGSVYLMGSNQSKPGTQDSADADNYKVFNTNWNSTWKIIKRSRSGLKMYITFASPEPFPVVLPTPLAAYERLNTSSPCTSSSPIAIWKIQERMMYMDNAGDYIVTDDLVINSTFTKPTLATAVELRAGSLGANLNGAEIWYSTDNGATYTNSGIVTAGHADNEGKYDIKMYQVEVANITNISIRKTGLKLSGFYFSHKEYAR